MTLSYLEVLLAVETISYFLQNSYLPVFALFTNSDKTQVSKSATWIDSTSSALKQATWICLLIEDAHMLAYVLLCFHRNHGKQEMPFLQTVTLHTLPFSDSVGKQTASKIHCQGWTIQLHSTMCTLKKTTGSQNISSQNGFTKTTKPSSWSCTRPTPRVTHVPWEYCPNENALARSPKLYKAY